MKQTSGSFSILAGLLTLVAVAVYGAEITKIFNDADYSNPLHWAYGLGCIAGAVFLINGIVLAVLSRCDMKKQLPCDRTPTPPQQNPMQMVVTLQTRNIA